MKKTILDVNISQTKSPKVAINSWVNTAINGKKEKEEETNSLGKKLQVNMSICKTILHKK